MLENWKTIKPQDSVGIQRINDSVTQSNIISTVATETLDVRGARMLGISTDIRHDNITEG
jgi:hypothetical protein